MSALLKAVAEYYSSKIQTNGTTHAGVDWNSREGQLLRFDNLMKVLGRSTANISLDDYGCGYGALWDHLSAEFPNIDYLGVDISEAMILRARSLHGGQPARFAVGSVSPRTADYAVASGIFNVRLEAAVADWESHILDCLDEMNSHSLHGFAFNCLTSYSDPLRRKDYLYYGDPCFYFNLCKQRYSTNVALLHDYGLFEFTILVRKDLP